MRNSRILLAFFTAAVILNGCQDQELNIRPDNNLDQSQNGVIEGKYIVVLKESNFNSLRTIDNYTVRTEFVRNYSMNILSAHNVDEKQLDQVFSTAIQGFSVEMNEDELNVMQQDPRVKYIEQDQFFTLAPPPGKGKPGGGDGGTDPQSVPWGISRVNGGAPYSGSGIAWIIDSGIDLDHPDLNVDVDRSKSFLGGKDSDDPNDGNGHGSHVAGTIAAIDNSEGVIGVAPGATVVAVRVLNRRGSGTYSGVIAGVDYVASNGSDGDVANMSLGGGFSEAMNDAVIAASSKVKFVLAAGNESDDANSHSPASANGPNIYTVSAMSQGDTWASFSNYGNPPIDYCGPGVGIESTWKNGGYNTISGTSMAAPHIAGVLLLGSVRSDGPVSGDPDSNPDPIGVH
jgi:subtilisin family serine protease